MGLAGLLGMLTSVTAQSFLTNGLVAYYPFNGDANDAAGTNNGVVHSATLATDRFGLPNKAYSFNGTNAYIASTRPLQDLTNSTLSVWYYLGARTYPKQYALFADSTTAGGYDFSAYLTPTDSTTNKYGIFVVAKDGFAFVACTNATPQSLQLVDRWVHFTWTVSPTNSNIYIDGNLVASANVSGNNIGFHATSYLIGANNSNPSIDFFYSGLIDDVRIYNRALSESEVAQLYSIEGSFLNIRKAIYLDTANVQVGSNYQLQVSPDMQNWTNHGSPFTATDSYWRSTNYWDVENWDQLFFRLVPQ